MSTKNPHDPKTYNEYRAEAEIEGGKIKKFGLKVLTERKTVRITDRTAQINNYAFLQYGNGLWYELPEEKPKGGRPKKAEAEK